MSCPWHARFVKSPLECPKIGWKISRCCCIYMAKSWFAMSDRTSKILVLTQCRKKLFFVRALIFSVLFSFNVNLMLTLSYLATHTSLQPMSMKENFTSTPGQLQELTIHYKGMWTVHTSGLTHLRKKSNNENLSVTTSFFSFFQWHCSLICVDGYSSWYNCHLCVPAH